MRLFYFFCFLATGLSAQAQLPVDTIYFNKEWSICEKQFSTYYRTGHLVIDSFWYYRDVVTDYYLDGRKEMEGFYDSTGYKAGKFRFYHPNGALAKEGNFVNNEMQGTWNFFNPDGSPKAIIHFNGKDFTVQKFVDTTGKTLLDSTNGEFIWPVNQKVNGLYRYLLKGEYRNGERAGIWKFYDGILLRGNNARYEEVYKNGKFKKGYANSLFHSTESYKTQLPVSFLPAKLLQTEQFKSDFYFRDAGDSTNAQLYFYLKNKEEPLFNDTSAHYLASIEFIYRKLYPFRYRLVENPDTSYKGKVQFLIGDDGKISNIIVDGNLSSEAASRLRFLLQKFRGLKTQGDDKVGIDTYHTMHFFTFDSKDLETKQKNNESERFFVLSPVPYEKVLSNIKTKKPIFAGWLMF